MKQSPITKQDALETWMADELADLAKTLPVPKAGLLVLDAQMTDLETRCALRQNRIGNQLGQSKDAGTHPLPRSTAKAVRGRFNASAARTESV